VRQGQRRMTDEAQQPARRRNEGRKAEGQQAVQQGTTDESQPPKRRRDEEHPQRLADERGAAVQRQRVVDEKGPTRLKSRDERQQPPLRPAADEQPFLRHGLRCRSMKVTMLTRGWNDWQRA
jgi:hypothetical protein